MELRHLRTIVAVANHRSFTKAADELHLAQSAISQPFVRDRSRAFDDDDFARGSRLFFRKVAVANLICQLF